MVFFLVIYSDYFPFFRKVCFALSLPRAQLRNVLRKSEPGISSLLSAWPIKPAEVNSLFSTIAHIDYICLLPNLILNGKIIGTIWGSGMTNRLQMRLCVKFH